MKWSKLKQRIEAGFADRVRGRVEVWTTRYRHAHDSEGEAWITLDGERILSLGTYAHWSAFYPRADQLRRERGLDDHDPDHHATFLASNAEVARDLEAVGSMTAYDFTGVLFDYLNLSIDEILASDRPIIRALGMLDRRIGKRRLTGMDVSDAPPLVRQFHALRCDLDGLRRPPAR